MSLKIQPKSVRTTNPLLLPTISDLMVFIILLFKK
ncbi:unnamed protein product [Brassica rapa subsp. trilocularis]